MRSYLLHFTRYHSKLNWMSLLHLATHQSLNMEKKAQKYKTVVPDWAVYPGVGYF